MVFVGPVEVGTPSKNDHSLTSLQTWRNSSLMVYPASANPTSHISSPRERGKITCNVPDPGTSSLTNALDPDPIDMEISVVTNALESAPRWGVPRKYRLWMRLAMSA